VYVSMNACRMCSFFPSQNDSVFVTHVQSLGAAFNPLTCCSSTAAPGTLCSDASRVEPMQVDAGAVTVRAPHEAQTAVMVKQEEQISRYPGQSNGQAAPHSHSCSEAIPAPVADGFRTVLSASPTRPPIVVASPATDVDLLHFVPFDLATQDSLRCRIQRERERERECVCVCACVCECE
jgi:hypothetical protein